MAPAAEIAIGLVPDNAPPLVVVAQVGHESVLVARFKGELNVAVRSLSAGCAHAPFQNLCAGAEPKVSVTAPVDAELVISTPSPETEVTPLPLPPHVPPASCSVVLLNHETQLPAVIAPWIPSAVPPFGSPVREHVRLLLVPLV